MIECLDEQIIIELTILIEKSKKFLTPFNLQALVYPNQFFNFIYSYLQLLDFLAEVVIFGELLCKMLRSEVNQEDAE